MEASLSGSRFHHSFGLGLAADAESGQKRTFIVGVALRGHPIVALANQSFVKDPRQGAATECRPYNRTLRNNRRLVAPSSLAQLEQLSRLLDQRRQHFFDVPFPSVLQIALNINSQGRAFSARA